MHLALSCDWSFCLENKFHMACFFLSHGQPKQIPYGFLGKYDKRSQLLSSRMLDADETSGRLGLFLVSNALNWGTPRHLPASDLGREDLPCKPGACGADTSSLAGAAPFRHRRPPHCVPRYRWGLLTSKICAAQGIFEAFDSFFKTCSMCIGDKVLLACMGSASSCMPNLGPGHTFDGIRYACWLPPCALAIDPLDKNPFLLKESCALQSGGA
ncbi:hypothetical protein VNO77_27077 [Canavalia gladiata]|uniref:Uncharacterized protein n=1 Tax=Canavalia gladiata TaxID=3824 RepID=A0AAN9QA68_CANGL